MLKLFPNLAERLVGRYRRMSIHMVISLSFTAVAVVGMIFLGMTLALRFSAHTQDLMGESSRRVLSQVNLGLDSYLRQMMGVSDTIYYNILKYRDAADRENLNREINLLYEENRSSLVSVAVFNLDGSLVCATPLATLKEEADPVGSGWFQNALARVEEFHFSTPHVQNLFSDLDYRAPWVVSLSRQVQLTSQGVTRTGVLLVDMSFSGIQQICRDAELTNGGYLYLVDQQGEIIYHPRQQLIYAGLVEENAAQAAARSDGVYQEVFQGQERQVTVKTVGYTGWKLVGVVPMVDIRADGQQMLLFGLSLLLFSAFLMAFLNFRISAHISQPIQRLEQSIKELEAGRETEIDDGEGCYEVQHLSRSIRSMVSTMRHLMEDIIIQEEQKRRSELEVLQSQINPHFLYNTLDSVIWMTEAGRQEEAIQMVTSLARLFRISLSRGSSVIPLADELEHARHYMTIQKIRYKNRFTFDIQAGPEVEGLYTLKLIVQPLLENAIYHGLSAVEDDGHIRVTARRLDGRLVIEVEDDGMGMPPEVAAQLLEDYRPAVKTSGSGIGIRNVHRRIQLTFGKDYGLQVESEPDEGTRVRIILPVLDEAAAEPYRKEIKS